VSNFEQTIAVHICCFGITGGLRCPDLIQRHQALLGLVALCFTSARALYDFFKEVARPSACLAEVGI